MKVPSCISNNSGGKYPHQPSPDGPTKRGLPQNDWRNYSFNCQSAFQWGVTQLMPEVSQFCWQTKISKSSVQPQPSFGLLGFSATSWTPLWHFVTLSACVAQLCLCLNDRTSPALEKWIPAPGNARKTSGNTYHNTYHNTSQLATHHTVATRTATCHPGMATQADRVCYTRQNLALHHSTSHYSCTH